MKKIFFIFLIPLYLLAYKVEILKWKPNFSFYHFLKSHKIPLSIYYTMPAKLKKEVSHIPVGEDIFILKNNGDFKQVLFPLNSQEQLQIIKKGNKFIRRIVPIIYDTFTKKATITIKHYLRYDVYKTTGLLSLSKQLISIFSDKINFRRIPSNTVINVVYEANTRYGRIKNIKVLYASIKNKYYDYQAFLNPSDGKYYDEHARSLKGMFLPAPLHYKRISSYFGMRFHPILHKWRMHDGIDFVNKVGTPIYSVANGKIIYKGWIKGYGRSVEIRHKYGYVTLYAHLHGWPKKLRVGEWVKQGQIIGYLGDSGLSTGPHLHFGVMHNGKWINPLKIRKSVKITLWGKKRRKFLSYIKKFQEHYNIALK